MDDAALGAAIRALRHRRGWRQVDLARRAAVSGSLVVLVEAGRLERVSSRAVRKVAAALDLRLGWDVGFRGAELARLRDQDHAGLGEIVSRLLERLGWIILPEVSFNHFGERGRIDLLAYQAATRTLLIIELKTVIVDVQATLGAISIKERVAPHVVQDLGWHPAVIASALVVRSGTTNRRRLAEHARLFAQFTLRGRAASTWLRRPTGAPDGLLLWLTCRNATRLTLGAPDAVVCGLAERRHAQPQPQGTLEGACWTPKRKPSAIWCQQGREDA